MAELRSIEGELCVRAAAVSPSASPRNSCRGAERVGYPARTFRPRSEFVRWRDRPRRPKGLLPPREQTARQEPRKRRSSPARNRIAAPRQLPDQSTSTCELSSLEPTNGKTRESFRGLISDL